ncbi:MAG: hypothetical protein ACE5MI_09225 [Acidimicrobiia bacterium]
MVKSLDMPSPTYYLMVSGSGIDRDRLTGGPGIGLGGILLVVAVLLLIGAGVWYVGFRSPGESVPVAATTTTSTSPEETGTTLEGQTTTTGPVTATTIAPVGELVSIPVLTEAEAYRGEQARLVWLPGSQSAWIVDMQAATVGRLLDIPAGPRGWGAPARDGSLIVDFSGRILRRTPTGEWLDMSPSGDRSYRILDTRTGQDHLHIYAIESGDTDRLLNLMYRYDAPDVFEEKWVADATDIVRASASKSMQLVIVELTPSAAGAPRYLLLSEQSGRQTTRSAFPKSVEGSRYVWGVEFAGGSDLFYMQCEAATYAECGASDGFLVNLSSGALSPVGDAYPGWSREWETPLGVPSFTNSFGGLGLLVRTNVDVGDLQSGERGRLISARDY